MSKNNAGSCKFISCWPVILLLVLNTFIGILTFQDFGNSYDEHDMVLLAQKSLEAYKGIGNGTVEVTLGDNVDRLLYFYGPSYVMGAELVIRLIEKIAPSIPSSALWHLIYFLTFQGSVFCFYSLARRFVKNSAAIYATVLFSTQPLLWGHSFINPKDIPFMAFFMASVLSGLWMNEKIQFTAPITGSATCLKTIGENWTNSPVRVKAKAIIVGSFWAALPFTLLLLNKQIKNLLDQVLSYFYRAEPDSWAARIFEAVASNRNNVPLESYLDKMAVLFRWGIYASLLLCGFLFIFAFHFTYKFMFSKNKVYSFLATTGRAFLHPRIILAAIFLGLTTSMRIIGPLAGVIITIYFGKKNGFIRSMPYLIAYALMAIATMYITWPYIWHDPVQKLLDVIRTMSQFPWPGKVLFDGKYYLSPELPITYIPVLMGIQFTEPVLILFSIGAVTLIYEVIRKEQSDFILLFAVWFLIPIIYFVVMSNPLYDNFRQLLFLCPPVFLLCGVATEKALGLLPGKKVYSFISFAIMVFTIIPGVYNSLRLHPYEYIYYNSYIGGVSGSFRRFENDYWLTSCRAAIEYLDGAADEGANIAISGPVELVSPFARDDLNVTRLSDTGELFDYVILTTRGDKDLSEYPDSPIVFSVERGGVTLVVVRKINYP